MGRPRTDISTRILHAARARFLVDGVDGASLRTIAKDAKTNIGMIFYYYPTKEKLFLAVVEEVYAKLLADLEAILQGEPTSPFEARLARAFERLGRVSDEELDVIRMVIREALVSSPRLHDLMARFRRGHIGLMLGAVGEAMEKEKLAVRVPLPLVVITIFAMGGAPQLVRRIMKDEVPFALLPDSPALAQLSVGMILRAITADAPAPKMTKAKPTKTTKKTSRVARRR